MTDVLSGGGSDSTTNHTHHCSLDALKRNWPNDGANYSESIMSPVEDS